MEMTRALGVAESGCRRVAVIGAGSMGAGIAAQFANAGVPVDLLDIPADGERDGRARAAIDGQVKRGGFMGALPAPLVRPGNIEDHMERLAEADWIIEAVIENLDIKRDLFARIEAVRKPGAVVSSNTSTIPRTALLEGRSAAFADHFLISHFFNPPRHMALLELVGDPEGAAFRFAATVGHDVLGKTVIACRDTPGFVANRIGCTWMAVAMTEAVRLGLTVEQADAIHGAFGVPRTGVFGLADLVGVDMIPSIWGSLMSELPAEDAINRFDLPALEVVSKMIDTGLHGRKSGSGFYRLSASGTREALDLTSVTYRPAVRPELPGGGDLSALLADDTGLGAYARSVLSEVLGYAAHHAPEIASERGDIDTAMELGYAWRKGPFRLLADLEPIAAGLEGFDLPSRPVQTGAGGVRDESRLDRAKAGTGPIIGNDSASLWDLGEGIACFEIHTKMNMLDHDVFALLDDTLGHLGNRVGALVIGNGNPRSFSAGGDLNYTLDWIAEGKWTALAEYVDYGQRLYAGLRYAPVPVVAAVSGLALGGACELLMHADDVVAHAEAQIGLPEMSLGFLPPWGGTLRLQERLQAREGRAQGPVAVPQAALSVLMRGRPQGSAREAVAAGLLPETAGIVMPRGRVFEHAVARAASLMDGYEAPARGELLCGGPAACAGVMSGVKAANMAGSLSDADLEVAGIVASVLTGGEAADLSRPMPEAEYLALEREAFVALARLPLTPERIRHVLRTGKPLKT